jgi:hypothetical protein
MRARPRLALPSTLESHALSASNRRQSVPQVSMESGHHRNARFVGKIPEAHDHGAGAMLEETGRAKLSGPSLRERGPSPLRHAAETHDSDATQFQSPNDTASKPPPGAFEPPGASTMLESSGSIPI